MKTLKRNYLSIVAAAVIGVIGITVSAPTNAQLATFDMGNFMQNLQQVEQLTQQMSNLQNQLSQVRRAADQAKQSYDSFTGSSGMGNLLHDATGSYSAGGLNDISSLAAQIKQKAGYLSTQNLSGVNDAVRSALQQKGDAAVDDQARMQRVFDQSGNEFSTIDGLMDEIDVAQDPKQIAGLQARIQVQQVTLQNQLVRAQAMSAMMQAQDRVDQQQQRQQAASERFDYYRN